MIGAAMGHAVHYRSANGESHFDEVDSLDAALAQVERLRNDQGVSDVRVYREVPIAFKAYYKATVAEDDAAPTAVASSRSGPLDAPSGAMPLTPPPTPPAAVAVEGVEVDDAGADADGKRGSLFSRG